MRGALSCWCRSRRPSGDGPSWRGPAGQYGTPGAGSPARRPPHREKPQTPRRTCAALAECWRRPGSHGPRADRAPGHRTSGSGGPGGARLLGPRRHRLGAGRGGGFTDAQGGVIVGEQRPLGRLLGQFLKRGGEAGRRRGDQVPLGGGRQADGQGLLQARDAMERQPTAVLEQRDHGCGARAALRVAWSSRKLMA
jgi:hypothetical protein